MAARDCAFLASVLNGLRHRPQVFRVFNRERFEAYGANSERWMSEQHGRDMLARRTFGCTSLVVPLR